MTLVGLAVLDLWRKPAMGAVQLAGLVTAIALGVALPLMQSVAAEAGLHAALGSAGGGTDLEIGLDNVNNLGAFDRFQAGAASRVRAELGSLMIPGAEFARSNQLQPFSLNGVGLVHEPGDPFPVASYYQDLQPHVVVTSGSWPEDGRSGTAWWTTVSQAAATAFGLAPGDVYCAGARGASRSSAGPPLCLRVGAVWKPRSESDPYWAGQLPDLDFVLGRASVFSLGLPYISFRMAHLFAADLAQVHAADAPAIEDHLLRLEGEFGVSGNATFTTGLGDTMQVFLARLRVEQALVTSVEVALIAVALLAIALAALHFVEAQRPLLGLWRARGGSRLRAWSLLMLELGALTLIAVPAGAVLGLAVVAAMTSRLFRATNVLERGILLSAAPTLAAVLVAVLAVLGLVAFAATRRSVVDLRRSASQPAVTAWWRRPWIEGAFAAGGVVLLAEYQAQAGQLPAGAAEDAITLALPGLALALLAVAGLRLLAPAARLLARGSDLGVMLARWRLERQPLQHARVALLLSFALALGMFSSAYLSTDRRNAVDRAAYQAGSDVRVSFGFGTAPSVVDQAVAATPGRLAAARVFRDQGRPGRSDVATTVLGVDPYPMTAVAAWRPDYASRPLADLMSQLARDDPDGVAVPGRPTALSMWVYSSGFDATLTAELAAADGRPVTASFGSLAFAGWKELQASLGGAAAAGLPLRLRTLRITPGSAGASGQVSLSDLRAGPAGGSGPVIEAFSAKGGWWREATGEFGGASTLEPGTRTHDGSAASDVQTGTGGSSIAIHPPAPAAALPGIMAATTAAKLGIGPGQTFPLHIETEDVNVRLVAVVDYFPTLYPGQDDFLVLPGESLTERLRYLGAYAYPNEAWMSVAGSTAAAAAAVTKATHGAAQVTDRETLQSQALANPLRLSLDAALVIGFFAALAVVVVSFGLHFLAAARARVGESAIMQANGLPWSVVDRGLVVEQAVVLFHGLIAGTVLGAVLAWAILPVLQTSALADEIIPPTVVTLDPRTLLGAAAALVASAAMVGWLAIRAAAGFRLADELRALA